MFYFLWVFWTFLQFPLTQSLPKGFTVVALRLQSEIVVEIVKTKLFYHCALLDSKLRNDKKHDQARSMRVNTHCNCALFN